MHQGSTKDLSKDAPIRYDDPGGDERRDLFILSHTLAQKVHTQIEQSFIIRKSCTEIS